VAPGLGEQRSREPLEDLPPGPREPRAVRAARPRDRAPDLAPRLGRAAGGSRRATAAPGPRGGGGGGAEGVRGRRARGGARRGDAVSGAGAPRAPGPAPGPFRARRPERAPDEAAVFLHEL